MSKRSLYFRFPFPKSAFCVTNHSILFLFNACPLDQRKAYFGLYYSVLNERILWEFLDGIEYGESEDDRAKERERKLNKLVGTSHLGLDYITIY